MKYNKLKSLNTKISELSLGTFPFKGWWGDPLSDKKVIEIINRAVDLGVNYIDTADVYGLGIMESLLGKVLKDINKDILVATKGGRDFTTIPGKISKNFDVQYLKQAFKESLNRLQCKYVDVYFLHGPEKEVIEKGYIFDFVEKLKSDGLARAVGLSINSIDEMQSIFKMYTPDIVSIKYNYLSDFDINPILQECAKRNIDVILREPLERGLLSGKYDDKSKFPENDHRNKMWDSTFWNSKSNRFKEFNNIERNGKTKSQLAIDYSLQINGVKSVLFGVKTIKQLEENLSI